MRKPHLMPIGILAVVVLSAATAGCGKHNKPGVGFTLGSVAASTTTSTPGTTVQVSIPPIASSQTIPVARTTTTTVKPPKPPKGPKVTTPKPPVTLPLIVPPGTPYPNRILTPGVVDPAFSMTQVCANLVPADQPTDAVRAQVFQRYGIAPAAQGNFVLDRLVARVLGGTNDAANLWPLPLAGPWLGDKQRLDSALDFRVCGARNLSLASAQQQAQANWYIAFLVNAPALRLAP